VEKANRYYAELVDVTAKSDGARAEVRSARMFAANLASTKH
jgi:hypothetical protein